ncbi:MAG: hypothetical protein L3I99_07885 [Sulfurimonas sp.]|nr:hypothetical protein [Sulfurimonas sp.]
MTYINDKYLTDVFDDARLHLKDMLKDALDNIQTDYNDNHQPEFLDLLEVQKVVVDFCNIYDIDNKVLVNSSKTDVNAMYHSLQVFFADFLKKSPTMYENIFAKKIYTFTEEEHETIQTKINDLRDKILKSTEIDKKHRERVLKKLEEMQKELHKKMANLDKFLGGMVSVGHALGLTAKEAKPFTDDVKDILNITLNKKAKTEELPENNEMATEELLQITE